MKIVEAVQTTISKYPDNIAYQFMGKCTSYSDFFSQIEEAAKALTAIGVKEDDIICIAMPNVPQAIILLYAANKIGAIVEMIHPLSSENEIMGFVNRVEAKTILVLDQFYGAVKSIREKTSLQNVIVAGVGEALDPIKRMGYMLTQGKQYKYLKNEKNILLWGDFLEKGKNITALPEVSDRTKDVALILHSGGTTGKVKGVCLSNDSINFSAIKMMEANPMLNSSDRFLSVMPIFHGNGLVIGVHSMLMLGARCVLIPRFTPETYAKDLLKSRCNYMSGVPALFEKLMDVDIMKKADLSFLKGVFSGADYLSVELERKINAFLEEHNSPVCVRQGYGMTEGVVASTVNPPENLKEGSIGKALPDIKVKIVEPGGEKELPHGEIGEIVFSSNANMMYYYDEPEETANTLKKHADGEYWVHSGDVGTEDDDGFFYFKGRIKQMVVINGYNVFPNELESIIEGFEMVDKCSIMGVQHTEGAQRIKAFIVLNQGYEASDEMKQKILELCRKSIAKYSLPKEIEFLDEMPKTKVGKVDIKALREKAGQ